MRRRLWLAALLIAAACIVNVPATGQMVGERRFLTLDGAKAMGAAAVNEAKRNGWDVAIAIVDKAGELVYFERFDKAAPASIENAIGKARTAARYERPTKVLEDDVAGGRSAILGLPTMVGVEGGLEVRSGDQIIGGIGVSGATSPQDTQVARAGLVALK
jgi:glc operon protein GlcG